MKRSSVVFIHDEGDISFLDCLADKLSHRRAAINEKTIVRTVYLEKAARLELGPLIQQGANENGGQTGRPLITLNIYFH